jgi:hypothetical protein
LKTPRRFPEHGPGVALVSTYQSSKESGEMARRVPTHPCPCDGATPGRTALAQTEEATMKFIPLVEHIPVQPGHAELAAVERLAEQLRAEQTDFQLDEGLRDHCVDRLDDGPALHLDDLSAIAHPGAVDTLTPLQDRARLRAGDGDLVATCSLPVTGYEDYCRTWLGLGAAEILFPRPPRDPLHLALACWEDRAIRRKLIQRLRAGELAYLHPHMGSFAVWELAVLLYGASRRPVKVIAPPPALCQWVNDKIKFTGTVARLFGKAYIPRTTCSWNLTALTHEVKQFSARCQAIGVKLPHAAGGDGTLILDATRFRGRALEEIREMMKEQLPPLGWDGRVPLLVNCWETQVLAAPSAQLWIPPLSEADPIVEGLFLQAFQEGANGIFVGARRADLPADLIQEMATRSWLLARLFQMLGYVGRCSFDLLLVGDRLERCRAEFLECNGRWGGTSGPMTLMNRLFGDWYQQPYVVRALRVPRLDRVPFPDLLAAFQEALYDVRTGHGRLILLNASRMRALSEITVICLGRTCQEATEVLQHDLPCLLARVCP